jgi:hypothetical protein
MRALFGIILAAVFFLAVVLRSGLGLEEDLLGRIDALTAGYNALRAPRCEIEREVALGVVVRIGIGISREAMLARVVRSGLDMREPSDADPRVEDEPPETLRWRDPR